MFFNNGKVMDQVERSRTIMKNKKNVITDWEKNSVIVLVLTTFASGLNYVSQILLGRFLDVSSYGILNSVFSLMIITGVIGSTVNMIVANVVAENYSMLKKKDNESFIKYILMCLLKVSSIMVVCSIVIACIYNIFYMINDNILVFLVIISIVINVFVCYIQGVLGGLQSFTELGLVTLIIPLFKILGVFIVKIGNLNSIKAIDMVIFFYFIGNIASICVGVFFIRCKEITFMTSKKGNEFAGRIFNKYYLEIFIVNMLLMLIMNLDVIYLKIFIGSEAAGLYSSGLMFGRVIYYCVTALVSVLLPMVAYNKRDGERNSFLLLQKSLIFIGILTIVFLIPVNIGAKPLLTIIFGAKYIPAIPYMKYASFISVSTCLNTIFMNYLLGIGKIDLFSFFLKTLIIGIVVILAFLVLIYSNEMLVLLLLAIVGLVIFLVNYMFYVKVLKQEEKD